MLRSFFAQENKKQLLSAKLGNQQIITPLRLQAFERMILFLERINPNSVIMRLNISVPASVLEAELLKTIRSEYEHNLAQQIYMSKNTWDAITKAKDETIKLISIASSRVNPAAPGMELAQNLLAVASQLSHLPTKKAIDAIKEEIIKEM
jgi:hypothetical protein